MDWSNLLKRLQSPEYIAHQQANLNDIVVMVKKRLPSMSSEEIAVKLAEIEESDQISATLKKILTEESMTRAWNDSIAAAAPSQDPDVSCPDCKQSPCVAGEWTCT